MSKGRGFAGFALALLLPLGLLWQAVGSAPVVVTLWWAGGAVAIALLCALAARTASRRPTNA